MLSRWARALTLETNGPASTADHVAAFFARVLDAGSDAVAENIALELGEDGERGRSAWSCRALRSVRQTRRQKSEDYPTPEIRGLM
jgi:hypothetical protein